MLLEEELRLLAAALKRYGSNTYFDGVALALRLGYDDERRVTRLWAALERHACVRRAGDSFNWIIITKEGDDSVGEWERLRQRVAAVRPSATTVGRRPAADVGASALIRRDVGPFCPTCGAPCGRERPAGLAGWFTRALRALGVGR